MILTLFAVFSIVLGINTTSTSNQDLDSLKNEVTDLKSKIDGLQQNYTLLESALEKKFEKLLNTEKALLQEKFMVLQQDVVFVNEQLRQLTNKSQTPTDNKIPMIENQIQTENNRVNALQNETQLLQDRISAHMQDYSALKNTVNGIRLYGLGTTAFRATTKNQSAVNSGEAIKFEHAELNEGNAYNTATGIFTCPRPGLFKFAAFIKNYERAHIQFRLNGENINMLYDGYQNSSSISYVLKLNLGDKVWVSHDIDRYELFYHRDQYIATGSFMGYLISS